MSPFWMYGVQTAEVEVDLATGQVEIVGIKAFHDVGRAINPVTVKQQLEGALMMGVSGATTEDVVLNDKGATLNANLHDYKISTAHGHAGYRDRHRGVHPGRRSLWVQGRGRTGPGSDGAGHRQRGVRGLRRAHQGPADYAQRRCWRALKQNLSTWRLRSRGAGDCEARAPDRVGWR